MEGFRFVLNASYIVIYIFICICANVRIVFSACTLHHTSYFEAHPLHISERFNVRLEMDEDIYNNKKNKKAHLLLNNRLVFDKNYIYF